MKRYVMAARVVAQTDGDYETLVPGQVLCLWSEVEPVVAERDALKLIADEAHQDLDRLRAENARLAAEKERLRAAMVYVTGELNSIEFCARAEVQAVWKPPAAPPCGCTGIRHRDDCPDFPYRGPKEARA